MNPLVVSRPGVIYLPDAQGEWLFRNPVEVVKASRVAEVRGALAQADAAVAKGKYAAGYVAYEAAGAFDPALDTHAPGPLPLVYFGIYDKPEPYAGRDLAKDPVLQNLIVKGTGFKAGPWRSACSEQAYADAIASIRRRIAAGDTYQVNYAFPLHAAFSGNPVLCFDHLCLHAHGGYRAYIDMGGFQILSFSPELFFSLDGERLMCKPMKGTRPRGRWEAEDAALAKELHESEKDRAENIMIVDMVRNDLGRIAVPGSVEVTSRFEVERFPTVWQMTSTVTARTCADVQDIFVALFPAASVTGAPKVKATQIIRALEPQPRGVYCGAMGWWGPKRQASFNVAIRTLTIDRERGEATYPIGSGIVWDSSQAGEYRECLDKAALVTSPWPNFELLETLKYADGAYFLLEDHLKRVELAARYFGYAFDRGRCEEALWAKVKGTEPPANAPQARMEQAPLEGPLRVRLLVARDGTPTVQAAWLPPLEAADRPQVVYLAKAPVDSRDVFLYHKTTNRGVCDRARREFGACFDVILWNERGELTEFTCGNIVLKIVGEYLTPPVESGILAGTMRARLLAAGRIREAVLTLADLERAEEVVLINSVREWVEVAVVK